MIRTFIQLIFMVFLLLLAPSSIAVERSEMIQFFIELEEVEARADEIVEELKHNLIRSDKKITDSNFERDFGDIFEHYREAYITANENAYSAYSDEQIKELYDFYKSPFSEWLRQQEEVFGSRVNDYMDEAGQVLRAGIQSKLQNGKKRKKRKKK